MLSLISIVIIEIHIIIFFYFKYSGNVCANHSIINMFAHIGTIIVEKKGTLEQATEDAIEIGAEDVEEFEENDKKYFQVYKQKFFRYNNSLREVYLNII